VRVFVVVLEPILASDFMAPTTGMLHRIPDPRARHYWDEKHAFAKRTERNAGAPQPTPNCCDPDGILWDLAAVYPKGARWGDALRPSDGIRWASRARLLATNETVIRPEPRPPASDRVALPGISGIEALKILQEDSATAHIPVVALSANAIPRDIQKGLEAGFFRYLTKPIKVGDFTDALNVALEFAEEGHARVH
jgi:DNA-binding NarL/FixJ family response regulator